MKLNNRGFGIGVMIGFLCVFFIAIFVVSILASHLGVGDNPTIKEEEQVTHQG